MKNSETILFCSIFPVSTLSAPAPETRCLRASGMGVLFYLNDSPSSVFVLSVLSQFGATACLRNLA
jgi:hypothetical protein